MKIIDADYEIMFVDLNDPQVVKDIYNRIETVGRICYKSETSVTDDSAEGFIRRLIARGHEAMLEHASLTVKFTVDRGVSHEIVRHRLASFAQESTRYCNYSKGKFGNEITVIDPVFFKDISPDEKSLIVGMDPRDGDGDKLTDHELGYYAWREACNIAEDCYMVMLSNGATPQEARSVLPNSLKTDLVMTANIREWRHFLNLRAAGVSGKPHPQMLEVAVPLLNELRMKLPALFDDIHPMEET